MKPRKNEIPKELQAEKIASASEPYRQGNDSPIRIAMRDALDALQQKNDLFIDSSGNIYTRNN